MKFSYSISKPQIIHSVILVIFGSHQLQGVPRLRRCFMPCGLHLLGQSGGTAGVCEFVTVEGWDIPGGKHRNDVEKP